MRVRPHGRECGGVDHPERLRRQRTGQRDVVGLAQHLVELVGRDAGRYALDRFRAAAHADHAHLEGRGEAGVFELPPGEPEEGGQDAAAQRADIGLHVPSE